MLIKLVTINNEKRVDKCINNVYIISERNECYYGSKTSKMGKF